MLVGSDNAEVCFDYIAIRSLGREAEEVAAAETVVLPAQTNLLVEAENSFSFSRLAAGETVYVLERRDDMVLVRRDNGTSLPLQGWVRESDLAQP